MKNISAARRAGGTATARHACMASQIKHHRYGGSARTMPYLGETSTLKFSISRMLIMYFPVSIRASAHSKENVKSLFISKPRVEALK